MFEISVHVEETNLSEAWARAFLAAMGRGVKAIVPLNVAVRGLDNGQKAEDTAIRGAIDGELAARRKPKCLTVSNTIFPENMWVPGTDRNELFTRYKRTLPKIKEASRAANRYGLYFERLISFGSGPKDGNQLEHVIETYRRGNHRRSALQAAVFDPARDHSNQPRRGFPCLHQVAFTPLEDGKLAITGFYATQDLVAKAYGNYVGLYNLGRFMAHEMGLELSQLNCVASVARLGDGMGKEGLKDLRVQLEGLLKDPDAALPTPSGAAA